MRVGRSRCEIEGVREEEGAGSDAAVVLFVGWGGRGEG